MIIYETNKKITPIMMKKCDALVAEAQKLLSTEIKNRKMILKYLMEKNFIINLC